MFWKKSIVKECRWIFPFIPYLEIVPHHSNCRARGCIIRFFIYCYYFILVSGLFIDYYVGVCGGRDTYWYINLTGQAVVWVWYVYSKHRQKTDRRRVLINHRRLNNISQILTTHKQGFVFFFKQINHTTEVSITERFIGSHWSN